MLNSPINASDPTGHQCVGDPEECEDENGLPINGAGGLGNKIGRNQDDDDSDPVTQTHDPSQGTIPLFNYGGVNYYSACGSNFLTESVSPEWSAGGAPTVCTQTTTYTLTADETWHWNISINNSTLIYGTSVDMTDVVLIPIVNMPADGMGIANQVYEGAGDIENAILVSDTITMNTILPAAGAHGSNVQVSVITNMYSSQNSNLPPAMSDGTLDFTFVPASQNLSPYTAFVINSPNFQGFSAVIVPQPNVGPVWQSLLP